MSKQQLDDDSRRDFLITALRAGVFAVGNGLVSRVAYAGGFGKIPKLLPPGQSIYEIDGEVKINGTMATEKTLIKPSDHIETGRNSKLVFVVGQDAFLLRENSDLQFAGDNLAVQGLRLLTGALLSVFGKPGHQVTTPTATIGIRGTGLYIESELDLSYVCTCYGKTELGPSDDVNSRETITSLHHDAPRYILASGEAGKRIRPAPFKNHTDLELTLIEALVGRVPPFALFDEGYGSPRRY